MVPEPYNANCFEAIKTQEAALLRDNGVISMKCFVPCPRILSVLLILALASPSLFAQAPRTQDSQTTTQQRASETQQTSPGPGMVDPSAAPLTPTQPPAAQQLPSAPSSAQQSSSSASAPSRQPQAPPTQQEPLGTAAAESIRTTGGAASRPAGTALAPAKQHQTRSLFIKIGAVAAIGVAAGVVYGLSRATSSVPPNTR